MTSLSRGLRRRLQHAFIAGLLSGIFLILPAGLTIAFIYLYGPGS